MGVMMVYGYTTGAIEIAWAVGFRVISTMKSDTSRREMNVTNVGRSKFVLDGLEAVNLHFWPY